MGGVGVGGVIVKHRNIFSPLWDTKFPKVFTKMVEEEGIRGGGTGGNGEEADAGI